MQSDVIFDWQAAVEAKQRLQGVVRHTPLIPADDLTDCGCLFLKAECLQRTHAFKFRGAYNRVSLLTKRERDAGQRP